MSGFSLTSQQPSGTSHVPNDLHALLLCLVECCTKDGSDKKDKDVMLARYYPDIGRCPIGVHTWCLLEAIPREPVESYVSDTCNTCPARAGNSFLYPSRADIRADRDAIVANPSTALAAIRTRWETAYKDSRDYAVQEERRSALGTDAYNRPSQGVDRDREESRAWWLYLIAAYGIGRRIVNAHTKRSEFHSVYEVFIHNCAADLVKRNEVRGSGASGIMRCWCPVHQKPDAHLLPLLGATEYDAQCGLCPIPRARAVEHRTPIVIIRDIGSHIEAATQRAAARVQTETAAGSSMEVDG